MSNAVFPTLAGLTWDVGKKPFWHTLVHEATSGKELRVALMSYPLYQFTLSYDSSKGGFLRADANAEFQNIIGFFNARSGSFDSFLYNDPTDHAVTAQQFGTGDGATTVFQITRAYGGFTEPVQNVNGSPSIYDNGSLVNPANYSISSIGVITFNGPPPVGHSLTWSGNFYYRCRFLQDAVDFNNFMYLLWELKQVQFQSVKL